MPQPPRYTLLSEEDEDVHLPSHHPRRWQFKEYFFLGVATVALLQSIAGLTIAYLTTPKQSHPRHLEVVSQYVGLDRALVHANPSKMPPITTYPMFITRINASEPDTPSQESYPWHSTFGTVYLQKRNVVISTSVSTVVQFRAGDYGFENCTLVVNLPNVVPEAVSVPDNAYAIDIWRLDEQRASRAEAFTWNGRPKRDSRLSPSLARPGYRFESSPFDCAWGSIHTFEFAAAEDLRHPLRFVQDPTEHGIGILLKQYATIRQRN